MDLRQVLEGPPWKAKEKVDATRSRNRKRWKACELLSIEMDLALVATCVRVYLFYGCIPKIESALLQIIYLGLHSHSLRVRLWRQVLKNEQVCESSVQTTNRNRSLPQILPRQHPPTLQSSIDTHMPPRPQPFPQHPTLPLHRFRPPLPKAVIHRTFSALENAQIVRQSTDDPAEDGRHPPAPDPP